MKKLYKHNIFKLLKNNEKILRLKEKKHILHRKWGWKILQRLLIRHYASERMMEWRLQSDEWKKLQLRKFYPARHSFRFDRGIQSCTDRQMPRELSTTKPALQEMLEELQSVERKRPQLETRKLWNGKAHQ